MNKNTQDNITILHLIESANCGGAETVVIDLCKYLGFRCHVASLRTGWVQKQLEQINVPSTRIPYRYHSDIVLAFSIAQLARQLHANIIHCHCFTMNTIGALGAAMAGIPSVATIHGVSYDLDTKKRRIAYCLSGLLHKRIIAVSHYLAGTLHETTHIPKKKIEVIYNGVSLPPQCDNKQNLLRPEFGFDENDFVVGSIGMLRPEKGHADLLTALKLSLSKVPNMKLLLVGDGKCYEKLQKQASEINVKSAVYFARHRDDVPAILKSIDVFALPSHLEGLSIATIEAMASGIPVVVTDCGGPREIVTDKISGLIVPPHDPKAMSDMLIKLANDPSLRAELASNGRKKAINDFTIDGMVREYERVYLQAANLRGITK